MNDNNKKDKTDYIKGNFKRRVLDISKLVFYIYFLLYLMPVTTIIFTFLGLKYWYLINIHKMNIKYF